MFFKNNRKWIINIRDDSDVFNRMLVKCIPQIGNSTYQSTLTRAQMEIFNAPSTPASVRRAWIGCSQTHDIYRKSVRSYTGPGGGQRDGQWGANRDTQQHHVKVNRNRSHRSIRLVSTGRSSAHSMKDALCHTEGRRRRRRSHKQRMVQVHFPILHFIPTLVLIQILFPV